MSQTYGRAMWIATTQNIALRRHGARCHLIDLISNDVPELAADQYKLVPISIDRNRNTAAHSSSSNPMQRNAHQADKILSQATTPARSGMRWSHADQQRAPQARSEWAMWFGQDDLHALEEATSAADDSPVSHAHETPRTPCTPRHS